MVIKYTFKIDLINRRGERATGSLEYLKVFQVGEFYWNTNWLQVIMNNGYK
jgi:hypothetical protein